MLYGIALPPYSSVRHLEGAGNFAVKKYYRFPFNLFYVMKLRLITDMLDPTAIYRNILDFGAGKAEIFKKELDYHALSVKCVDIQDPLDSRWRFDVIVCSSVLEFVNLEKTIPFLRDILVPNGILVAASPMEGWASKLYFRLIGDHKVRRPHQEIRQALLKSFKEVEYKEWFGLYFVMKVKR